jgi:hypothetical protein
MGPIQGIAAVVAAEKDSPSWRRFTASQRPSSRELTHSGQGREASLHHLDRDHCIVDEKSKCDDERPSAQLEFHFIGRGVSRREPWAR